jgi:hypothetical protein
MVKDGTPWRILMRQQPPLRSGAQQIEDGIDDAPDRIGLPPSGRMAAGNEGLEQRPLGIGEIAGVGTGIYGGSPGSSNSPHPPQRPAPNRCCIKRLGRAIKSLTSL